MKKQRFSLLILVTFIVLMHVFFKRETFTTDRLETRENPFPKPVYNAGGLDQFILKQDSMDYEDLNKYFIVFRK